MSHPDQMTTLLTSTVDDLTDDIAEEYAIPAAAARVHIRSVLRDYAITHDIDIDEMRIPAPITREVLERTRDSQYATLGDPLVRVKKSTAALRTAADRQTAAILDAVEAGEPKAKVAAAAGMSRDSIYRMLDNHQKTSTPPSTTEWLDAQYTMDCDRLIRATRLAQTHHDLPGLHAVSAAWWVYKNLRWADRDTRATLDYEFSRVGGVMFTMDPDIADKREAMLDDAVTDALKWQATVSKRHNKLRHTPGVDDKRLRQNDTDIIDLLTLLSRAASGEPVTPDVLHQTISTTQEPGAGPAER